MPIGVDQRQALTNSTQVWNLFQDWMPMGVEQSLRVCVQALHGMSMSVNFVVLTYYESEPIPTGGSVITNLTFRETE
jgi:hypothetical protein